MPTENQGGQERTTRKVVAIEEPVPAPPVHRASGRLRTVYQLPALRPAPKP